MTSRDVSKAISVVSQDREMEYVRLGDECTLQGRSCLQTRFSRGLYTNERSSKQDF